MGHHTHAYEFPWVNWISDERNWFAGNHGEGIWRSEEYVGWKKIP